MSSDYCDKCKRTLHSSKSGIVNGIYYKNICTDCLTENINVTSGDARWSRTVDMEDHSHELLQPYGADGKPNPDFIKAYPSQAESIMTPEELTRATRN